MGNAEQSNTQVGDIRLNAGEALTGLEGCLVKLGTVTGQPAVLLPDAQTDLLPFVLIEGDGSGSKVTVRPLEPGRNVRLRLSGVCAAGDLLVPADTADAALQGMVTVLPVTAGSYRVVAIAEAAGVDGGLPLCRPVSGGVVVVEAAPGGEG